ncbi:DUF4231 domain-containing protein [Methanococcoides burtonii]|uniref:DUF4231 domain-containing protein n=1 Tax=Methanococcoides burtonii (strain DSM 6242 / NBRC 107633 / OCM 468 / ACE-M) TaxID=259564 RepID=Q12VC7_METBU|nr:DUF4231 domain-containing protein [Methanococcoides burtonii]ABE52599.1 Hypothetical protein Mbur_1706 [Methanococcoides burtonii DSM 6242]
MANDADATQDIAEQYLKNRLEQYRSWYDNKAVKMKKRYQQTQAIAAIGAVLVPVINNVSIEAQDVDLAKLSVTLTGILVALAIAFEGIFHYKEQWKNYRSTEQYLETQKQLFVHRIGDYSELDEDSAFKLLVNRIESAIAEENAVTLNILTRVESNNG